tara:strand:- start:840 stop:1181 length:342 start_codon:yes stop_codon:yes gene_type:complete
VTIYHNPQCSKSRDTLQILLVDGHEPIVINYLESPPSVKKLEELLSLLDMEPRELMRHKEAEYGENGLNDPNLSRETLIKAMVAHPILIERPIVIHGNRAIIGRPPETVRKIL